MSHLQKGGQKLKISHLQKGSKKPKYPISKINKKPLNSIVNIILLTMYVRLVVSGDHSIIEQDSLRSIIYFVFILFKTNISSRRANILFANSVTEPLICLVTVQNRMDRSIKSTCNKQTIVS